MAQKKDVKSGAPKPAAKRARATPKPAKVEQAESKSATIIALLRREDGATLDEMMAATGWQQHSVRGFLAGTLRKRHGLTAGSDKTERWRAYRIAPAAVA